MKHVVAWSASLAAGGVVWLLVSTSANKLYPLLLSGSPWIYWVVSVSMGLAAFVWVLNGFYRFSTRHDRARNPLEDPEYVRMYWESIIAQEGGHDQQDWIYDDQGRILGPLDHESGEIITVEQFVLKMSESVDDNQVIGTLS